MVPEPLPDGPDVGEPEKFAGAIERVYPRRW
jgi:hypothetical protein